MVKRICLVPLAVVLLLLCFIAPVPVKAVDINTNAKEYFSSQLNENAKAIYKELESKFTSGEMKDGTKDIDLVNVVSDEIVKNYIDKGDRTLPNDFAAAKDAFDLQHPEAWYIDSSFLTLRVVKDAQQKYHPLIGAGRSKTYYLDGVDGSELGNIDEKTESLNKEIDQIANDAKNQYPGDGDDVIANRVKFVHDKITRKISYRFENECKKENPLYIRTSYGLITHEGVCESYARSFQMCMNKLNIPCTIIMGMQTSGNAPEQHMWTAVKIGQLYYIVDPTWDDPIKTDQNGNPVKTEKEGEDGCEHSRYLLVGTDSTPNWIASGKVSSSQKEFEYPPITNSDYSGGTAFGDKDGLEVKYTSAAEVDGAPAGQFIISYKGEGITKAGQKGYHLLIKMYDNHDDGTSHSINNWYYVEAGLAIINFNGSNPYFYDTDTSLRMFTAGCEYVEYAITTREPDGYKDWNKNDNSNPLRDPSGETGYYHGDGSDIFSETGKLYNVNSSYEAAPYVYRQYPSSTQQVNTGVYEAKVVYDDSLNLELNPQMKPTATNRPGATGEVTESGGGDPFAKYARVPESEAKFYDKNVKVKYECTQLDVNGNRISHKLQSKVKFDEDEDGFVDSGHVKWLFDCQQSHTHDWHKCKLVGAEFEFDPSVVWADDTTYYTFTITNVYGSRSSKAPNSWGYLVSAPTCPFSYRSQGIDWNLWGRPNLLDNPDDINLSNIVAKGVDGHEETLDRLQQEMNLERLNGRLTLVVEDLSDQRDRVEEMEDFVEENLDLDGKSVKKNSLYEINFNRMCNKTLREINNGDSMRLQIGFPEGFNAQSNVVFKAYHFERDKDGKITKVTEIPIVVTEYGLIVLCDSFSPFELVALDSSQAGSDENVKDMEVAVVGDGNTNIYVDGTKIKAGKESIVDFNTTKEHTFKFEPKSNDYKVESVQLLGSDEILNPDNSSHEIKITKQQLETIKQSKQEKGGQSQIFNTILSVTSVPNSVIEQQTKDGSTVVQPKVCSHQNLNNKTAPTEPTCEKEGSVPEVKCIDCGAVISEGKTIEKLGHEPDLTKDVAKVEPTCDTEGSIGALNCRRCGEPIPVSTSIPAKGHNFGTDGECSVCHTYDYNHDQALCTEREILGVLILEYDKDIKEGRLNEKDYSPETWSAFIKLLEEARKQDQRNDYTKQDKDTLKNLHDNLKKAKEALVWTGGSNKAQLTSEPVKPEEANLPAGITPETSVHFTVQVDGSDADLGVDGSEKKETITKGKKTFRILDYDKNTYSFIKWLVKTGDSPKEQDLIARIAMTSSSYKEYPSETITLDVQDTITLKPVFVKKDKTAKLNLAVNPSGCATIKYKDEEFGTADNPLESINVIKNDTLLVETQQVGQFKGQFLGWASSDSNLTVNNKNGQRTGAIVGSGMTQATLTANYTGATQTGQVTVQASSNPPEGGTITGAGTYNVGTVVTLKATPNRGYNFTNWTLNGKLAGNKPELKVAANSNITYVANFTKSSSDVQLDPKDLKSFSLSATSLELTTVKDGTTSKEVTATIKPENYSGEVTWKSKNPSIAKVSGNNRKATVTAVSDGTTTITATVGDISKVINVTVQSSKIVADSIDLFQNDNDHLQVIARNVHLNTAINNNVGPIRKVSIFAWSDENQGDINAKEGSHLLGSEDYNIIVPINGNEDHNYFTNAGNVTVHVYASTDKDSVGEFVGSTKFNWGDRGNSEVKATGYSQDLGFITPSVGNNAIIGTTGQAKHLEGLRLASPIDGVDLQYSVHASDIGWLPDVSEGTYAGTMHQNRQLEAVKVNLTGPNAHQYNLSVEAHVADKGWLPAVGSGEVAGTTGEGRRLEAVRINIQKK